MLHLASTTLKNPHTLHASLSPRSPFVVKMNKRVYAWPTRVFKSRHTHEILARPRKDREKKKNENESARKTVNKVE